MYYIKMNKYTRIKAIGDTSRSMSIDFSDHLTIPEPTNNNSSNFIKTKHNDQDVESPNKTQNSSSNNDDDEDDQNQLEEPVNGESFDVKLRRNSSVSSSSVQTAMRRVFSLRRSSSVSERYCRIHDQFMALESPTRTYEDMTVETTRAKSQKNRARRGSFFRSCKKLFGF